MWSGRFAEKQVNAGGVLVVDGGATVTSGGLVVTAGGATVVAGGAMVEDGGASIFSTTDTANVVTVTPTSAPNSPLPV